MSKYTAEQVEEASRVAGGEYEWRIAADMLRDLANRLRQEEQENKRDPVTDPKTGDSVVFVDQMIKDRIFVAPSTGVVQERDSWAKLCKRHGATIIRRREVSQ